MAQKYGVIYYDYIDANGVLKGGMIEVDPTNPKHTVVEGAMAAALPEDAVVGVETIIDNGPTWNRVDLAILGDGYLESELDEYASDVADLIAGFFAEPPFDEYASFFNVHRVDIKSEVSGIENCNGEEGRTPLEMCFGGVENRVLYINVANAEEAADHEDVPDWQQILALANTERYGGVGNPDRNIATLSGHEEFGWTKDIGLHEFGHSFGELGDEYWEGNQPYEGSEENLPANLSTYDYDQMKIESAKWYRWLDEPTVPPAHGPIDTYPGGGEYYATGIYRPTDWSKMRRVDHPFHQVNAEQFIFKIYELVKPIDYATPEGTYAIGKIFFVEPVKPATHSLDVTWYRVGDPDPVGTGPEFDSSTLDLPTGEYTLQVEVVDNTGMVKDEDARDDYMTEWREWTLGEAAHWKFDETEGTEAEDSIGNNNGILGISPYDPDWVEDEDPVRGSCLEFDGGDYVSFSTMDALEDSDATISAWIKAKNLGTVGIDYYSILSQLNGSNGYELYINGDKPAFRLNDTYSVQSSEAIDEGKWYHLAGTYDGSDLKIYVNGELTSRPVSGLSGVSNTGYIGWLFDGRIDDVRVYDWVLDMFGIWDAMSGDASRFRIKDSSGETVAWFDSLGNLCLKGSKQDEWKDPDVQASEFIVEKNSGPTVYIDDSGNLFLQGAFIPGTAPSATGADEFRVQDSEGIDVAIIRASNGDVRIKGKLYENAE
jgi:hypothetical protein